MDLNFCLCVGLVCVAHATVAACEFVDTPGISSFRGQFSMGSCRSLVVLVVVVMETIIVLIAFELLPFVLRIAIIITFKT